MKPIKNYYTKREILDMYKISLPTLNRDMKNGLKYYKVGRNVLFRLVDVKAYMKKKYEIKEC